MIRICIDDVVVGMLPVFLHPTIDKKEVKRIE
jgi:hypothetical protein